MIHQVHRRPAGLHPVVPLGVLGVLGLVFAIVLLAVGSLVAGLIVLCLASGALALWFGGIRGEPLAPGAKHTLRALNRFRALFALGAVGVRAWTRADLELAKIHLRRIQLRRQLKACLAPLGEAVHRGDQTRAQALRELATGIERDLGELEQQVSAVTGAARARLARERESVAPTRSFSRVDAEGSGAKP